MKNKLIIAVISAALLSSCSTYERSLKREKELTEITMTSGAGAVAAKQAEVNSMAFPFIPVLNLLLNIGSVALEKESKKYASDYAAIASVDGFYPNGGPAYTGFTFKRTIEEAGNRADAMTIKVGFSPSDDESAFRMRIDELKMDYARCKVREKTGKEKVAGGKKEKKKQTVDVVVKITIESSWSDANGLHIATLANDEFSFANIDFANAHKGNEYGKWIPKIPVSSNAVAGKNQGNVTIKVVVVETDEFGEHLTEISKFLTDNKDDIVGIFEKE